MVRGLLLKQLDEQAKNSGDCPICRIAQKFRSKGLVVELSNANDIFKK